MLPAGQRSHTFAYLGVCHIDKAVSGRVAEDRPLHVCRFQLAAFDQYRPVSIDQCLSDVQGVIVIFRKPKRHHDFVFGRTGLDGSHFLRIDGQ